MRETLSQAPFRSECEELPSLRKVKIACALIRGYYSVSFLFVLIIQTD